MGKFSWILCQYTVPSWIKCLASSKDKLNMSDKNLSIQVPGDVADI